MMRLSSTEENETLSHNEIMSSVTALMNTDMI